ncbi:hypothetical protein PUMCH_004400 [Australozyma saopauloensis]|uniref:ATP-dependent RNA helicase SUV3, mitochondrial n=1 Tax=Australozyma saopauloensis TaxID=291208 RepID=A0AAX4HEQ3_9ASCO|nr:hypothetical protein PUMCH_004400 [[Candida] saopauloensis]
MVKASSHHTTSIVSMKLRCTSLQHGIIGNMSLRTFCTLPILASKKPRKLRFPPRVKTPDTLLSSALKKVYFKIADGYMTYPFEILRQIPTIKAISYFDLFRSKIKAGLTDHVGQTKSLDLADFIKPRMDKFPAILDGIFRNLYPKHFMSYRNFNTKELALTNVLTNLFQQFYIANYVRPKITKTYYASENWDLRRPHYWYPEARKMRRKIVMHVGPTNSGKTHHSLKQFIEAKSGYYAGPLRMLAREVYERFKKDGVNCNLITGEEIIPSIDEYGVLAGLSAGTIEMIPLHKKMDICIIDEIQMLTDEQRGCAWTNAVLGVQAKELHLCGEERTVDIIKKIAEATGDDLEIKHYTRLGKLSVMEEPLKDISDLQSGDCVVFFSKRKILDFKCKIELKTNLKVGVIYGALPPEVRAQESDRFNNGEYDVLVASDAIGMGINLKIKRVVFGQTTKYNGQETIPLSASSIKQIGGRAGRYSTSEGELEGFITAFRRDDLRTVREVMSQEIPSVAAAGIWPPDEFWLHYVSAFDKDEDKLLSNAFKMFYDDYKSNPPADYFLMDLASRTQIVDFINKLKISDLLSIDDQLRLSQLPFNLLRMDDEAYADLRKIIMPIVEKKSRTIFDLDFLNFKIVSADASPPGEVVEILKRLEILERDHKLTLVFMWLAQRWPTYFVDKRSASQLKSLLEKRISEELDGLHDFNEVLGENRYGRNSKFRKDTNYNWKKQFIKKLERNSKPEYSWKPLSRHKH